MDVLVTGATGLVGTALVPALADRGHRVRILTTSGGSVPRATSHAWDPDQDRLDDDALAGIDAVVHLAGENVAGGRWTDERKRRIRESRVRGTTLLARKLAELPAGNRPAVLVSASATGIYGDRGDEVLRDDSTTGEGFLADVARAWEDAADPARDAGIRVAHPRIGMVLSPEGGALGKMLTPFRLGLGGVLGPGTQWMSWITRPDLVGILVRLVERQDLEGPVAAVTPNPVRNREFTKTLGRVLGRPTILPVPSFAARLVFGEMADALLLASQRVEPMRLRAAGHDFEHPALEPALRAVLGK